MGVQSSTMAQSINIDSAAVRVDTLPQAKGGLEDIVDYQSFDSIEMDLANKMIYLYNKAHIIYGDIDLKADYIAIDLNQKKMFATNVTDSLGNKGEPVHFTNGDNSFDSDSVEYDIASKRARGHFGSIGRPRRIYSFR